MKEHPIIFSAPMVRAILEGRKTQTRRPLGMNPLTPKWTGSRWVDVGYDDTVHYEMRCRYGQVGDRLWVRESWGEWQPGSPVYKADGIDLSGHKSSHLVSCWRPSIHMPRWASRITLEITGIRIEQVQEITEGDAWSEGFPAPQGQNIKYTDRARYWFKTLWNTIYAKKPEYSWDSNPWVWVIYFRRLTKPEGE